MSSTHFDVNSISSTTDRLTGRAGLAPFAQYLTSLGLADELAKLCPHLKKNKKGVEIRDFIQSMLCWFMEGTSRHLKHFDELLKDDTIPAIFDVDESPSSHAVKRMLSRMGFNDERKFRNLLKELFLRQLKAEAPKVVWLGVDSMVLNNDDAEKRMGVEPTYKKVKGYHPLQITWNGMIIDAIFRRGSRHTHEFRLTSKMIGRMVREIREALGPDVAIIVSLDAGYLDQKLLKFLDEDLKVGFLVGAKLYKNVKDQILKISDENWEEYSRDKSSWRFTEMGFKCQSWPKFYRAIFSQVMSRKDGQMLLDFARPSSLFVTNLGMDSSLFTKEATDELSEFMTAEGLLKSYQARGAEELCHRGLKDFGFEQMPMQNHGANLGVYHLMTLAFSVFESFKREAFKGDVPKISKSSYASTVRRIFIDVAAKVTCSKRKLELKLRDIVLNRLNFVEVWKRCCHSPPLFN